MSQKKNKSDQTQLKFGTAYKALTNETIDQELKTITSEVLKTMQLVATFLLKTYTKITADEATSISQAVSLETVRIARIINWQNNGGVYFQTADGEFANEFDIAAKSVHSGLNANNADILWLDNSQKKIANRIPRALLLEATARVTNKMTGQFDAIDESIQYGSIYESIAQYSINSANGIPTHATAEKKKNGVFYTPRKIVDHMVKSSMSNIAKNKSFQELSRIKIVDPAMGSGAFLIVALDSLFNALKDKAAKQNLGASNSMLVRNLLKNNIYGVDLSPKATAVAKAALKLHVLKRFEIETHKIELNLYSGDSLEQYSSRTKHKNDFSWNNTFKAALNSGGFDMVVGNPPYVVMDKNTTGNAKYDFRFGGGKINLVSIFLHLGTNLLNASGELSFIIPRNLLADRSMTEIRNELFLNKMNFNSLEVFPKEPREARAFADAAIPALIVNASIREGARANRTLIRKFKSASTWEVEYSYSVTDSEIETLLKRFDAIPIVDQKTLLMIGKASKINSTLSTVFGAIHQGEINVSVFKSAIKSEGPGYQLLEGKNVNASRTVGQSKSVSKAIPESKLKYLTKPRLVMQGINGIDDKRRLIAVVAKNRLCAHSTNFTVFENDDEAHFFHAIISSTYVETIFRSFSCNNNINSYEIGRIPFTLKNAQKFRSKLIKLSRTAHKTGKLNQEALDQIISQMLQLGRF